MYVERLWLRDGEVTIVKLLVAHDASPLSFNSIEYATMCNDLDGAVSVNSIQESSTIEAGYLIGTHRI